MRRKNKETNKATYKKFHFDAHSCGSSIFWAFDDHFRGDYRQVKQGSNISFVLGELVRGKRQTDA